MRYLALVLLIFSTVCFSQMKETQRQELTSVNLLGDYNPGFENMSAKWTKTGSSTFAIDSSNYRAGTSALSWNASATGEYLSSEAVAVTDGLKGNSCMAGAWFKYASGSSGDVKLQAYDGSNVLAEKDINVSDYWYKDYVAFTCPTSGNIQFRLASTSDSGAILLDQVWVGEQNNLVDVSQAEIVGHLRWATDSDCIWSSTSGTLAAFAADTDCVTDITRGSIAEPSTKIPGATVSNIQAGKHTVTVNGYFYEASTAGCEYSIYDGSTNSGLTILAAGESKSSLEGEFEYTTAQGEKTFQIYVQRTSGAGSCRITTANNNQVLEFTVKRYPLSSEKAVSLDTQGAVWSGYHGETCQWSETSSSSHQLPSGDATCVFDELVNLNFGTVTSLADGTGNQPGFSFTPKRTGLHEITARAIGYSSSSGQTASYNLIYDGSVISKAFIASSQDVEIVLKGVANITSIGTKNVELRMMVASGGITNTIRGQATTVVPAVEWMIKPLTQNFPQAVAITDINPTAMSASAATRAGYYQYEEGTTYNGVALNITGTNWTTDFGMFLPYQTNSGSWRLRFNFSGLLSTPASSVILSIAGITFLNATYPQAVTVIGTTGNWSSGYADNNNDDIRVYLGVSADVIRVSGDIALDTKPTWAY